MHGTDRSVSGQGSTEFAAIREMRVLESEFTHGLARRLMERQNADGGWSLAASGESATESTAWALKALDSFSSESDRYAEIAGARSGAVQWLTLRQLENGAWPVSDRVAEPGASTGIAALALATCPESELRDRAVAGGAWLLDHPGRPISLLTRVWLRLNPGRNPLEIDMRFRGWPWMPGMWGWVEPTSTSMIAIRLLEQRLPRHAVKNALEDGESLLLDRACPEGGWNHGLGRSHEEDLWPYPDTTAFALLALGQRRQEAVVQEGLTALRRMLTEPVSRLSTALGILAFESFGQDADALHRRLVREWEDPAPTTTTRTLALSVIASGGGTLATAGDQARSGVRGTDG